MSQWVTVEAQVPAFAQVLLLAQEFPHVMGMAKNFLNFCALKDFSKKVKS